MLSSLRTVSGLTVISRLLGLLRDIGMAVLFGNGPLMDAFSVAFRIPNVMRRLFGEGALSTAFLPAFVGELENRGRESAWRLASSMLALLAGMLLLFVGVVEALLLATQSFGTFGDEAELLMSLTAILLPYCILICLSAQVSAIMHGLNHFAWPAVVPMLLNVAWIVGVWIVAPQFEDRRTQMFVVAAAIVFGGVLQLSVPLPQLFRLGFRYQRSTSVLRPLANDDSGSLRGILRSLAPVLLGLSIIQLNTVLDAAIAWGLTPRDYGSGITATSGLPVEVGSTAALYLGQRLYHFPLGVFGIALGTVLFPQLARHAQNGRLDLVRDDLMLGLRLVALIGIPASCGLVLLSEPLTQLLFQRGSFDEHDAVQTAQMISAYGTGIWAYCALTILTRACYALGDQKLPIQSGLLAMFVNLVLNLTLVWFVGGMGLAISTSLAAAFQCVVLCMLIQRIVGRIDWTPLKTCGLRVLIATAVMTAATVGTLSLLPNASFLTSLFRVVVPVAAAIVFYWLGCLVLGIDEWKLLLTRRDGA